MYITCCASSFATISSGLCFFCGIPDPLKVKSLIQGGPLLRGRPNLRAAYVHVLADAATSARPTAALALRDVLWMDSGPILELAS